MRMLYLLMWSELCTLSSQSTFAFLLLSLIETHFYSFNHRQTHSTLVRTREGERERTGLKSLKLTERAMSEFSLLQSSTSNPRLAIAWWSQVEHCSSSWYFNSNGSVHFFSSQNSTLHSLLLLLLKLKLFFLLGVPLFLSFDSHRPFQE